jgi:hypothetical protein
MLIDHPAASKGATTPAAAPSTTRPARAAGPAPIDQPPGSLAVVLRSTTETLALP